MRLSYYFTKCYSRNLVKETGSEECTALTTVSFIYINTLQLINMFEKSKFPNNSFAPHPLLLLAIQKMKPLTVTLNFKMPFIMFGNFFFLTIQ